jgi:hypothetical protein
MRRYRSMFVARTNSSIFIQGPLRVSAAGRWGAPPGCLSSGIWFASRS